MTSADSMWAAAGKGSADVANEATGAEVIQVELSWRDARSSTVLGVREVKPGETLALGEKGDMLVPEEVLCADRAEIVRFDGETATAHVPPGGKLRIDGWPRDERELEIVRGHFVEAHRGRLRRARDAHRRPARSPRRRRSRA